MLTGVLRSQASPRAFPGVQALDAVDLEVAAGEVHALVGENGAGKSTLMKIIAGAYQPDAGQIDFDGEQRALGSPGEASARGIHVIYQELVLFPDLTVAENIFLGDDARNSLGFIDHRATASGRARCSAGLGVDDRPAMRWSSTVGRRPADGRDRQGAGRRGQAPDPGRADRGDLRARGRAAVRARPPRCARGRRDHLHLAPARGDLPDRRPRDRAQGRPPGRQRPRRGDRPRRAGREMVGREIGDIYPPKRPRPARSASRSSRSRASASATRPRRDASSSHPGEITRPRRAGRRRAHGLAHALFGGLPWSAGASGSAARTFSSVLAGARRSRTASAS